MIYIFGHIKPDTDSICASISLSYLKNQTGYQTEPRALGSLSNEVKFVLDYFNLEYPKYLNDVKLQIKDILYHKDCFLNENESIRNVYTYMAEKNISAVPITDKDDKLISLLSLKDLTKTLVNDSSRNIDTSYDNILQTIKGQEILRFEDEIKGDILAAGFRSSTFVENVILTTDDILIVGDRHNILEYAIKSKVKLILIVGDGELTEKNYLLAKENKVNIIKTNFDTYQTTKLLYLSNYVKTILTNYNPIIFEENDYFAKYKEVFNKTNHTNYPVVDVNKKCLGLMTTRVVDKKVPKEVILVDHNEKEQTVTGIEDATILEIVDHHKIGNLTTNTPINFRNMTVGSTNTIIYFMYIENGVLIPREIAGAMLSAIISDTLLFQSPTTTELDKKAVYELEKIAKVDHKQYGYEMFKAASSLKGKTIDEVIFSDFKKFNYEDINIGIGQVMTMDFESINNNLSEYKKALETIALNDGYEIVCLFITDVIKNGSYIIYTDNSEEIVKNSFKLDRLTQGHYFDEIVSRKKQIIPKILEYLNQNN